MGNLEKLLKAAREKEEKAKEREKLEMELVAREFFKIGWDERGNLEEKRKASEAGKRLRKYQEKKKKNKA